MKDVYVVGPTYTADVSGVCSALYELGGMVVIHDPSGCNSTYNTHDEPRWYDQESLIYISGLSQMDALMGRDEKLIRDIVRAAGQLKPRFIALVRSPVPLMTGTDFEAVASSIEEETGIATYFFPTTGMHSYISGAAMAFEMVADKMVSPCRKKSQEGLLRVNLLGATPLDLSITGSLESIKARLEDCGVVIQSCMAMDSSWEEVQTGGSAHVNLVLSGTGLGAARILEEKLGIPYVAAFPVDDLAGEICHTIRKVASTGESVVLYEERMVDRPEVYLIGEAVLSLSLAETVRREYGRQAAVICPFPEEGAYGIRGCLYLTQEDQIRRQIEDADFVIADPLYQRMCTEKTRLIRLPHEACSGRCFRKEMPDLTRIRERLDVLG